MEDVKEFNKLLVKRDKTILGAASNLYLALKARWPDQSALLDELSKEALKLRARLGEEGWMGYNPKPKAVKVAIEEVTIDEIVEADELAKEVEAKRLAKEKALAEKKRVAEAKVQADIDRMVRAEEAEKKQIADEKAIKKAKLQAQLEELEV